MLLRFDAADQIDILRLLALVLVLLVCATGARNNNGARAGTIQQAFPTVDLDNSLVGVEAAIYVLGAVDNLAAEEMAAVSARAGCDGREGQVVAGFAVGVVEEIRLWGKVLVSVEASVEEVGRDNGRSVRDGADELLGTEDLGGGEVRASEVVGGDEDAEVAEMHL